MSLDDKPLGRLVLSHNKAYDFNLKTHKPKKKKGELLVDLKIDGLKGPIPKVIHPKKKMGRVFVDGKKEIEEFEMDWDKMQDIVDLSKVTLDEKAEKDKKEMAQIHQEAASPTSNEPAASPSQASSASAP